MTKVKAMLLALSATGLLGSLGVHVPAAATACDAVTTAGDFAVIAAPDFDGSPEIKGYAVDPYRPARLWVTNGEVVMMSVDSGCSWEQRFALDLLPSLDIPTSSAIASVEAIVVPEIRGGSEIVYLVVEDTIAGQSRPHVIRSTDGGTTWRAVDDGLPVLGAPLRLHAVPERPEVLYLLVNEPGSGSVVYRSIDEEAWERRGAHGASYDFAIDQLDHEEIWLWGDKLRRSMDGGSSSVAIDFVAPPVAFADVFHGRGDPPRIVAYEVEGPAFAWSEDGARTWRHFLPPPGHGVSLTGGNAPDQLVMSMHGGIYRFQPPSHWIEITPGIGQGLEQSEDYEPIRDLRTDRTAKASVFGYTSDAIYRYTRFSMELPPLLPKVAPDVDAETFLEPRHRRIEMEPGDRRTVDYSLRLPPHPTPLDVMFLMDTTKSMDSSIRGLLKGLHGIVKALGEAKIDVRFGVGEYKDYPSPGIGDFSAGDFPYRLNRDIGPADDSLVTAIERMEASGGGDPPESQLSALLQASAGPGDPPWVEPRENASFRPEAFRVIVNITDAAFHDSGIHPGPRFDAVARELKGREILQVGLAVRGPHGIQAPRTDLSRMAKATGALAPPGGIDCDGDGVVDRPEGDPLVCDILDEEQKGVLRLAPAILSSLRAVIDMAEVGLVPTKGDRWISHVDPDVLEAVDVKKRQSLAFSVTYKCPPGAPSRGRTELVATVRGEGVARASAEIACKAVPIAAKQPPSAPRVVAAPPPPEPVSAIVPAPAPVPPAAPVPQVQPQPQPNPHVQGALAHQDQEQVQVAVAGAPSEVSEEYAFSSYSRRGRGPGAEVLMLYGSALALSLACSCLALRRRHVPRTTRL